MKVFIIAAITADGYVARDTDDFVMDWTSPEDVKQFVKLTKEAGVIVMGSRTFETTIKAGRRLPGRKMVVYSSRRAEFEGLRTTDPTEITTEPPVELITRLKKEGYPAVAICGGRQINTLFIESGLVTDLYLTIEPRLFGTGISLFGAQKNLDIELSLESCEKLTDNALSVHYSVSSRKA